MAGVQQLKTWFLQITSVLRSDGTTGGVRFRKFDKPDQQTIENLMESVPFKKESGDRAKTYTGSTDLGTQQGIVTLATNAQAKANVAQLSNQSLVVVPSQLPTSESITNDFTISTIPSDGIPSVSQDPFSLVPDGTSTRNRYILSLKTTFLKFLLRRIVPSGGSTGDVLLKNSSTNYDYQFANLANNSTFVTALLANTTFTSSLTDTLDVGFMRIHPSTSMPSSKWIRADGSAISRTTYSTLFALLNTTYGIGDGSTTFNIPDYRDKQITGYSGTKALASTGGAESRIIGSTNLPPHVHGPGSYSGSWSHFHTVQLRTLTLAYQIGEATTDLYVTSGGSVVGINTSTDAASGAIGGSSSDGGFTNTPLSTIDPYLATNIIIKVLP